MTEGFFTVIHLPLLKDFMSSKAMGRVFILTMVLVLVGPSPIQFLITKFILMVTMRDGKSLK